MQNRVTGEIYESAQFLSGRRLPVLELSRETRVDYIKRFYDAVSTKISLPTPIMSGVRTNERPVQLLRADRECGDSSSDSSTPPPARL